jgi:16S rRNA (cytosine967-C5)-methyltransferase
MSVSVARRIAFEVLRRVEEDAYAADLLHARLESPEGSTGHRKRVKPEDAALATELTLGTLRWQRALDFLIEKQARKSAASLDAEVRIALRLGLYQLRFLSRIPPHAAVHESVELVKRAKKRSAASLVNAVLRRTPRSPIAEMLPACLPLPERLGIEFSHPTWLVERWLARFGEERTRALQEANNRVPRTVCAILRPEKRDAIVQELRTQNIVVDEARWLRHAIAVSGGSIMRTQAFQEGWISIQDEASQMVALLLGVQPGDTVLDVCAAPGGKTVHLAHAAGPKAPVVACDRHEHRLRAMRELLKRVGAMRIHLVALDAERALPFGRKFDRILVDAPCSGTGTLARNPEIRWRLRAEDLADLHARQVRFLTNALNKLAPGGRLVYSTCSLEPEENESVVNEVLSTNPSFKRINARDELAAFLEKPKKEITAEAQRAQSEEQASRGVGAHFDDTGTFRTFPPEHGTDGFFAVALEKRND